MKADHLLARISSQLSGLMKRDNIDRPEVQEEKVQGEALFSYSVMLPGSEDEDGEILVIGNFIIKNVGTQALTHPVLCLRLSPPGGAKLGGKISMNEHLNELRMQEKWLYLHDNWREKITQEGEYWLKPGHCQEIPPGQMLSFTHFELRIPAGPDHPSVILEGFAFFHEMREGIVSQNSIVINRLG